MDRHIDIYWPYQDLNGLCKCAFTKLVSEYCKFTNYCLHLSIRFLKKWKKNVWLMIAISGNTAYRYRFEISDCRFLLLRYSPSCIIFVSKTLAVISEFTIYFLYVELCNWSKKVHVYIVDQCFILVNEKQIIA